MQRILILSIFIFIAVVTIVAQEPVEAARRGRPSIECARLMNNGVELFVPGRSWSSIDAADEIKSGYKTLTSSIQTFFVQLDGKPKQIVFEGDIASAPSPKVPIYKMFFKVKTSKDALRIFRVFALALEKSTGKKIFDQATLFDQHRGVKKEALIEDLESSWDESTLLERIETGVIEGHMMEGTGTSSWQRAITLLNIDIPDPLLPLSVVPNNYLFLMMFHLGRSEEFQSAEMLHTLVSELGLSSSGIR